MAKKVLLTTIHSQNNNFGSVWQAYALSYHLEKRGYDVTTLDYRPYYSNGLSSARRIPALFGGRLLHLPSFMRRERKFESFISSRHLSRRYERYNELVKNPPEADIYLLGSDQVWNPDYLCGKDPAYYLEFAVHGPKIAYSASVGKALSSEEAKALVERVSDFRSVSLREDFSVKQLLAEGRLDAVHTLDPVFLLKRSDYARIAASGERPIDGGYILAYIIGVDPKISKSVEMISRLTGKPVVQIGGLASKCRSEWFLRDAGPHDFIRLIEGCDLLVTSSFHGLAFAHIMKKSFVALLPAGNTLRLESLLRDAGTTDRLACTSDEAVEIACSAMDYLKVGARLGPLVEYSKGTLMEFMGMTDVN